MIPVGPFVYYLQAEVDLTGWERYHVLDLNNDVTALFEP